MQTSVGSLQTSVASLQSPIRFTGTLGSVALTVNTNIPFTAVEDPSAAWNPSSYYWAAPAAGLYSIRCQLKWTGTNPSSTPTMRVYGGSGGIQSFNWTPPAGGYGGMICIGMLRLNQGDQVYAQLPQGPFTTQNDTPRESNFLGIKLESL